MNQTARSRTGLSKPSLVLLIAMWGALLAMTPLPVAADISAPKPSAKSDVNESSGAFSEAIEIEVPAFRGLEPKIALSYSSAGGNGFVGVGWTLAGLSHIERVSPGEGVANLNGQDEFMLDGQKLIFGCNILGGQYCTQHQSYQRISYDAATSNGGSWYVWDKDGSKSTYRALWTSGASTVRWALVSEQDTHGNVVNYGYDCTTYDKNCVPKSITYNNATITFYSETRPDTVDFATALGISQSVRRLRAITVKVGATHVRAYQLRYTTSAANGRSLLNEVQQYGSDFSINASTGIITAGSALPAIAMSYTGGGVGLSYGAPAGLTNAMVGDGDDHYVTGDFDGDGKLDSANIRPGWSNWRVTFGMGVGGVQDWPIGSHNVFEVGYASSYQVETGDFNGDGKTDIAVSYAGWGHFKVFLSTGAGFMASDWGLPAGGNNLLGDGLDYMVSGDFDGDGKTDLAWTRPAWGGWRVARSTGGGFVDQVWGAANAMWFDSFNYVQVGDFNGDGKTDIAYTRPGWNGWGMYISTGWGFITDNWVSDGINSMASDALNYVMAGDFNGDGVTDLAYTRPGWDSIDVFISTGKGFRRGGWTIGGVNGMDLSGNNFVQSGDFNGDGRADVAWTYPGWGHWQVYLATFEAFNPVTWGGMPANALSGSGFNPVVAGDFNGDGKTDLGYTTAGMGGWVRHLSSGGMPDLLSVVNNGFGGSTTVAYTPSSTWRNVNVPVGSISQTVASTTVRDGRGIADTTTYNYWDARWSHTLRRPLGYYRSWTNLSDGSHVDSYHLQTDASPGVLSESYTYADATTLLHGEYKRFTENAAAPYTSLVDRHDINEYNGNTTQGPYRTTRKEFAYDKYGNVYRTYDYGDPAISGDDTTTYHGYYPNLGDYIVSLPGYVDTYSGIGSAGTKLASITNYYDAKTSYGDPPTQGSLTKTRQWNNVTNTHVTMGTYLYDAYGNQISAMDAMGRITTTVYTDPATAAYPHIYPVKTCVDPAGLNQCTSTTWDTALGVPKQVKDPNNAIVSTEYDKLGRKISQTDAAMKVTQWFYSDWGQPSSQRVSEVRPDGSTNMEDGMIGLWATVYFDGLGRTWQTDKKGLTGSSWTRQLTRYKDASSNAWQSSDWHVFNTTPKYTVYQYDSLDRIVKTTHPDGASVTVAYANDAEGKPFVKTVREMGQVKAVWHDTDGNVTRIKEVKGGEFLTHLTYDRLGRKTKVVDAVGYEVWRATYNSLGHKLSEFDPNRGTRTYTYNLGGQLTKERNAAGQETTLFYDVLGRVKSSVAGGQTSTWYYDEAGYGHSIGRNTRIVYPGGHKEKSWDARGLTTTSKHCIGVECRTFLTTYDGIGRQASITYPDGEQVIYAYDRSGQMLSVTGAKSYVSSMTWTPSGQLKSMTYGNGTANIYEYDPNRSWLKSVKAQTTAAVPVNLHTSVYTYDNSARVASFQFINAASNTTTTYGYDSLDQLISVGGGIL